MFGVSKAYKNRLKPTSTELENEVKKLEAEKKANNLIRERFG